jgi:uncharacterized BrkB/YihY/UPF0761 family membrane protein
MDTKVLHLDATPTGRLRKLADAVNEKVLAMFALLAAHGRLPAWMESMWADVRAEANPIKEIAVGFILIGVALVIALTILPVITSAVNTAASDGNISATDAVLLRLLPTLLIVGLIAGGVAFLFRGFKQIKA